jgi:uroporphyrinogen decarboxylase
MEVIMNSRERIMAALSHKEGDRVPVYPILAGVTRKLTGVSYKDWSTDAKSCADAYIKAAREFDIDCVVTLIDLSVEVDAWGAKIIYPENEAAHPDYNDRVIKSIEDYKNIKKADYRQSKRMMMHIEVCERLVKELKSEKPIVAFVFGPLGTLSMLRKQQDLYMDLYDDPDAVKSAVSAINETLKDYVSALIDTGVDAIMLDTLFASGSIMSKSMWMEFEGVFVKELADLIWSKNCAVMIHNCGTNIYFDVQIETMRPVAISFLHPPDDCKDFAQCKEKYGKKTTLIGCVTPANAMMGSDEEWDTQCKAFIDTMSKDGGFILATGCEYPANASFDRAQRMIELAKTYGTYKK